MATRRKPMRTESEDFQSLEETSEESCLSDSILEVLVQDLPDLNTEVEVETKANSEPEPQPEPDNVVRGKKPAILAPKPQRLPQRNIPRLSKVK